MNHGNHAVDCVICMTGIDLAQRLNDYMVRSVPFFPPLNQNAVAIDLTIKLYSLRLRHVITTSILDACRDGWTLRWNARLADVPFHLRNYYYRSSYLHTSLEL